MTLSAASSGGLSGLRAGVTSLLRTVWGPLEGGAPQRSPVSVPAGRWADLALLQPVKDYAHRHASTLLVFEAVDKALSEIGKSQPTTAAASQ